LRSKGFKGGKAMKKTSVFIVSVLILALGLTYPEGDYLGQKQPGMQAQLFAPGIVCTGLNERDTAISPDGKEFYFTILVKRRGFIIYMKQEKGKWSKPEVASFSGKYSDLEPVFSPDGKKMFFVSNRPLSGQGEPKQDYDIWFVEREGPGWGEPQNPGSPLNSPANEFYPSITKSGAVYFCSRLKASIGGEDIFKSNFIDGKYTEPENLGEAINTKGEEFNAFVAPDESYIIYTTVGRGPGIGGGDLWINFRKEDGTWSKAVNMGENVNSASLEYCPFVTADGKFLFFTSQRGKLAHYSKIPVTYDEIKKISKESGNGDGDIYWINTKIIEELKGAARPL
jgi:Tol biopolymer transport system component